MRVCATLQERDKSILKHIAGRADKPTLKTLKAFLDKDREQREAQGRKETILDLSADMRSDLHALLTEDGLDAIVDQARTKLACQAAATDEAGHLQLQFESIPGPDAIAGIVGIPTDLLLPLLALAPPGEHQGLSHHNQVPFSPTLLSFRFEGGDARTAGNFPTSPLRCCSLNG